MKSNYCILFMLFAILASCTYTTNKKDTSMLTISVPTESSEQILNMSQVIDTIKYIPLETKADNTIGVVSRIFPVANKLIVVDQYNANAIFVFDNQGKYISKISKRGAGPEEYIKISSVTVDEKNERIFVLDASSNKILVFNITGECITTVTYNFFIREIEYTENDVLACYSDYYSNDNRMLRGTETPIITLLDITTNETLRYLYTNKDIESIETCAAYLPLTKNGNGKSASLYYPLNNFIYQIDKNNVNAIINVDFGNKNKELQDSHLERLKTEKLSLSQLGEGGDAQPDFFQLTGAFVSEDVAIIGYSNYKQYISGIGFYYFKSGKYIEGRVTNKLPIRNDIDNGYPLIPYAIKGHNIYTIFDTDALENMETENPILNKMKSTLTSDDNPIIMIASIKIR